MKRQSESQMAPYPLYSALLSPGPIEHKWRIGSHLGHRRSSLSLCPLSNQEEFLNHGTGCATSLTQTHTGQTTHHTHTNTHTHRTHHIQYSIGVIIPPTFWKSSMVLLPGITSKALCQRDSNSVSNLYVPYILHYFHQAPRSLVKSSELCRK